MKGLSEAMVTPREGWAKPPEEADLSGIYFVQGTPLRRHDLERCHCQHAYAVVLLGGHDEAKLAGKGSPPEMIPKSPLSLHARISSLTILSFL